jgi:tRNA (cytidine56-2'-O)-methyltransferase
MYGLPFEKNVGKIRKMDKDVLVVVGSEKVPGEVYRLCDYNLGVTSQPHSEVAALAVFLDRFFAGKELGKNFDGWKIRVTPCARGKLVEKR